MAFPRLNGTVSGHLFSSMSNLQTAVHDDVGLLTESAGEREEVVAVVTLTTVTRLGEVPCQREGS